MGPRKRSAAAAAAEGPSGEEAVKTPAKRPARGAKKTADPPANQLASSKVEGPAGGGKAKPPHYLMKSEPETFSLQDLAAKPGATDAWEGVRNAVARNVMQSMRLGDRCFFYHSSCKVPGIVGIVKVVREAYPDHTQFDKSSQYYDPKATQDKPRWFMVDVQLERRLERQITLEELKSHKEGALSGMALFRQSRLSVQPVSGDEWAFICGLEGQPPGVEGGGGGGGGGGRKGKKAPA